MLSAEEQLIVDELYDELTTRQKQALYLVCYNGYTQEQAAATLGVQQAAISKRMMRARRRIGDELGAETE